MILILAYVKVNFVIFVSLPGRHGVAVVSTASQKEGPGFNSRLCSGLFSNNHCL